MWPERVRAFESDCSIIAFGTTIDCSDKSVIEADFAEGFSQLDEDHFSISEELKTRTVNHVSQSDRFEKKTFERIWR
jgi:hypothetical protein